MAGGDEFQAVVAVFEVAGLGVGLDVDRGGGGRRRVDEAAEGYGEG